MTPTVDQTVRVTWYGQAFLGRVLAVDTDQQRAKVRIKSSRMMTTKWVGFGELEAT